jgi:hypothetical protein
VIRFLGGEITFVDRTETERTAYEYRFSLRHVEITQQNPYGLVVSLVEQAEIAPAHITIKKINSLWWHSGLA